MLKAIFSMLLLNVLLAPISAGQGPATKNDEIPTIRTTTREVILDLVVRDKHQHAITDLRPQEVEIYEDGVRQKLNDFRNVAGAEQLQAERKMEKSDSPISAHAAPGKPTTLLPELNFVSVVFADIAPLNLEFAREAVIDFLKSDDLPNTYVTIYRFDHSLQLVQAYTANKPLLMKAVDRVARGLHTGSDFGLTASVVGGADATIKTTVNNIMSAPNTTSATIAQLENILLNPLPGVTTDPLWARNAASEDVSVTLGNALLTQAHMQTGLRFADSLANGMSSLDALRQLVQSQVKLPGRKVILYLADGLTLPMDRRDAINSVIGYANRVDVSFYAVDTQGLSLDDPLMQSLAQLEQAGAESAGNNLSPRIGHLEDDDLQLTAVADKQLGMEELADSTGGFAVTNTNEIAQPMRRVMEDIRTHYELAYTPSATNYDGRFRKIEVRVARPHVHVQTRSGYFAVPDINGVPLQPYEMTALHAINARPAPNEFPYETALMKFGSTPDAMNCEMAFDIPISSLKIFTNHKMGKSWVRASVLALIHKNDGEVVGKVSRDLVREVSKTDLQHLADKHILYAEPLELPGGHYLVDTAVSDELGGKSTVKRLSVFIDSGKEFRVSSLELVRGIAPLFGPRNPQDPYETGAVRIMPTLADSVPSGEPISIYFVVYPSNAAQEPKVTIQLFRNGKEIARRALTPKRQDDGSMPMLLRVRPDPGQCDMIVTAQQGTLTAESRLSVRVAGSAKNDVN